MKTLIRAASLWCAALLAAAVLSACGGGDAVSLNSGATTTTSTTPTTATATTSTSTTTTSVTGLYLTGISYPLKANDSVHVPAGTQIAGTNGAVTTLNLTTAAINVPGGSVITVPATATGTASILVTTLPNLPYTLAVALPTVTLVAGTTTGPPVDGTGTGARFWGGGHLGLDAVGNLFMTDGGALKAVSFAGVVRTVSAAYVPYDWQGIAVSQQGVVGTIYGSGTSWAPPPNLYGASIQSLDGFGVLSTVVSNWNASPTDTVQGYGGLAVDSANNLYLTDAKKHRILKFTAAGVMSVFAGTGSAGAADGVGTAASFNNPTDLTIDGSGIIYVSDTSNSAIRRITPAGLVTTVAKQLTPGAIAASPQGVVYFVAGSPRTLFRMTKDLSLTTSFPLASITDPITALAADSVANVYVGTQGVNAQIFRLNAF